MKRILILAGCTLLAGCAGLANNIAESDIDAMERTFQLALEVDVDGATRAWHNDQTGSSGSITPLATYIGESGLFCRDYRDLQMIRGTQRIFESRACRAAAGGWVYVEDIATARRSS